VTIEGPNWEDVSPEVTDFIFYQAERHIEAQLQSGIASDARAISAASTLAPIASVVFAGSFGYWITSSNLPLLVSGLSLGGALLISAYFCFKAAKPVDFYFPGNQPEEWYQCVHEPISESKGGEIENYQSMIEGNAMALERSADLLMRGINIAITSPIVFFFVYGVTYLISCQA